MLLSSGLPITEALTLAREVVVKAEIYKTITRCIEFVSSGKNLSEGYRGIKKGIVPGIMTRITDAGERSGKMDQSMQELADYFDNEVSSRLKTLTTLLEPIMLVVIGLLVGAMMLAIIAPIYSLIGNISSR